jgi:aspartyl-tRNA(Asn)/glutamyl-tRNA(Gln) amidotransferase subunit C
MEIEHITMLARLELTEKEKEVFSKQLSSIIKYIDKLNELNTTSVDPTAHVLPIKNVFRNDELKPSLPKDKALQNAPDKIGDFYKVPKIIE